MEGEDRARLREEQEEAYDAALLEDVKRESLAEYNAIAAKQPTVETPAEAAPPAEEGDDAAPLSPASMRAARLLRFAPPPPKRRRRSEISILTGAQASGTFETPLPMRRTRSQR